MIGMTSHHFAMQSAIDAGNRSARAAGRTRWSTDDDAAARLQYDLLCPSAPGESARDALRRLVLVAHIIARQRALADGLAAQLDTASGAAIGVLTSP